MEEAREEKETGTYLLVSQLVVVQASTGDLVVQVLHVFLHLKKKTKHKHNKASAGRSSFKPVS